VRFLGTLGLALLLFPVGLATHEVMHLVVYSALGVPAVLVVTDWRLGSLGLPVFGLHAAPVGVPSAPFDVLVANNGLGPSLAALLLFVLWLSVGPRSRVARGALLGNVLALVFFAGLELAYPLIERFANVQADVLLLPELNYGGVLVILVLVSAAASWPRGASPRQRAARGGSPASAAGRLPAP